MIGNLNKKTMKKLLFLLTFVFVGTQAISQVIMLTVGVGNPSSGNTGGEFLTRINPNGTSTASPIPESIMTGAPNAGALEALNTEINNIIALGYKLIHVNAGMSNLPSGGLSGPHITNPNSILTQDADPLVGGRIKTGTLFLFAIP